MTYQGPSVSWIAGPYSGGKVTPGSKIEIEVDGKTYQFTAETLADAVLRYVHLVTTDPGEGTP